MISRLHVGHLFKVAISMAVLALSWNAGHAQGVLGSNYIETGVSYTRTNTPDLKLDTYTPFIGGNRVMWKDDAFEIAISGQTQLTVDDKRHFTYQAPGAELSLLPNYALNEDLRLFGVANLGYQHTRAATNLYYKDHHRFNWGLGAGLEYSLYGVTLIASADYMKFQDKHKDASWIFGGQVNYWLNQNWGVAGGYSYLDYKTGHANQAYARVRYRF
jgi:hypothetical protein